MARFTLSLIALFLFVASLLSVVGFKRTTAALFSPIEANPTPLTHCVVKIVYDGDTFGCDMNGDGRVDGKAEQVRLLGIDTTEMHYSRKNHTGHDEPYALEAKTLVEHKTLNRPVYLEYDQQVTDKYHRQLAYVYLDPAGHTMLNELLLQQGLARLLFIGVNRRYENEFIQLIQTAQAQHLKLWSQN